MAIGTAVETASSIISFGGSLFGGGELRCIAAPESEQRQLAQALQIVPAGMARELDRTVRPHFGGDLVEKRGLPWAAVCMAHGGYEGKGGPNRPAAVEIRNMVQNIVSEAERIQRARRQGQADAATGAGGLGINLNDPVVLLAGGALIFLIARG